MPANFCRLCGKKPTARGRVIDQVTAVCNECSAAGPTNGPVVPAVVDPPQVNDTETLSNVTFGALKEWLTYTNNNLVAQVEQRLTEDINKVRTELEDTKSNVSKLQKELEKCKKSTDKVATIENRVKKLEESSSKQKTVGDNNLKYLINLDRNNRRKNVVIFGVPENGTDLNMNGSLTKTDEEKVDAILSFIGTHVQNEISSSFRLGKPSEDTEKVRPIKAKCSSSATATEILKAAKKLKDLQNFTIYIKPDKTKSEVEEYRRLGKRKAELMEEYPVDEDDEEAEPRVVLEKGVLKVDGIKMDEFKSVQSLF